MCAVSINRGSNWGALPTSLEHFICKAWACGKWRKGDGFDQSSLGRPDVDTAYALCIYDHLTAVPELAGSFTIGPDSSWLNKDPKGYVYNDKDAIQDGVAKVRLKTGVDGKTQAQLHAKGFNVPMPVPVSPSGPYFHAEPNVTVQLLSEAGACWTSEFTRAAARKNDGEQFKAKAP